MLIISSHKKERVVVGLMSGTSADGIDAVLVKIAGDGEESEISLAAYDTLRYSPGVRSRILSCQGARGGANRETTLLDAYLGELFAHAVIHICKKAGVAPESVDIVGCHGQTLYHHPIPEKMPGFDVTGTLQVGDPAIIAERTGITVVSDFRSRDMAAGGQGAPLAPYLDYALYHHRSRARIVLNIGGISNLTAIPAGAPLSAVTAFDTGPGNCLIDLAVAQFTKGKATYDVDGAMARSGHVDGDLLHSLLENPFLKRQPPKSADKGEFGAELLSSILSRGASLTPSDVVATLTAFTYRSVAAAVLEFLLQKERYEELIVSGGGSLNPVIMEGLQTALPKLMITRADEYGIPSKAKEAVLIAFLANETIMGRPGNVPSATGARQAVVLGAITPGLRAFEEEG